MATQPDDIRTRRIEPRPEIRAVREEPPVPDTLAYHLTQDLVRWGPIVAGLVTALTSLVLLGLLGIGIGLSTLNTGANAAQGTIPTDAGRNSAAWAAISGLVAFFLGGL